MANAVEIVPFAPYDLGTTSLAVTATTGNRVLAQRGEAITLTNVGPSMVFARFGDASVTATVPSGATAGGFPVMAGTQTVVRSDFGDTHLALICDAGGTATVYISAGSGV